MVRFSPDSIKRNAALWLRQGISPSRLAFTLALGFAIGCIPMVGISTVLCAVLALGLGLNLPAIEAANYAAWPMQLILILPFVHLGRFLYPLGHPHPVTTGTLLHLSPLNLMTQLGGLASQAMLAWLLVEIPAVLIATLTLTPVLRRIPVLANIETDD
jgi:uncharacterized protein (DUF2062 family)